MTRNIKFDKDIDKLLHSIKSTSDGRSYRVCLLCGRKLRSTKSMFLGYGPKCYEKVNRKNKYEWGNLI